MKKIFPLILIILLPAQGLKAASGADAAAFLKIDAGARAAAMGGAFTAIADDASSIFYNPAGPTLMESNELFFSHNQWIEELNTEHISYVHTVSDKLSYFVGFATMLSPEMDSYDTGGNKTGSFNAVDRMIGIGASMIEQSSKIGYFLKAITQEAYNEKGTAYTIDLGFIKTYENYRYGLSAQNLGATMKMYEEKFDLPAIYRGGMAYRFMNKYWLAGDIVKMGKADTSLALGAEGEFNLSQVGKAYLRCGYNSGRSENTGSGISAGLGFSARKFNLDYAFAPFGDLGIAHRITLALKFGDKRHSDFQNKAFEGPATFEQDDGAQGIHEAYMKYAENHLTQKDYENAFVLYNKASKSLSKEDKRQIYLLERMGLTLLKQKNHSKAENFYYASIQIAKDLSITDTDVVNAYLGIAFCQEKMGKIKWSRINYKTALKLTKNPDTKLRIEKALKT
ncbi:MAG: PorV/PorQ family protein, partial [Elusimicrobiales bacterium]|nr:PorV/PorQ family protein [Elusimicrobiales bacterium]